MKKLFYLNKELNNYKTKNSKLVEKLDFLKQKEFDRLQNLELDDIDLISRYSYKENHSETHK